MIELTSSGSFDKAEKALRKMAKGDQYRILERLAKTGVAALKSATPVESGSTAAQWRYEIKRSRSGAEISWFNGNVVNGVPVAILLQYGHGTGTGGYVKGRDYINPAMKPVFDKIADEVWRAVTSA